VDKSALSCAPGSVMDPEKAGKPSPDPGRPSTEADGIKPLPGAVAFLNMGLSAAVCVGAGVVLGIWADDTWHTAPALLVVGLLLGLAAATFLVVGQIRKYL
jgi:F0F1-type ATP synthase assembly protein I